MTTVALNAPSVHDLHTDANVGTIGFAEMPADDQAALDAWVDQQYAEHLLEVEAAEALEDAAMVSVLREVNNAADHANVLTNAMLALFGPTR